VSGHFGRKRAWKAGWSPFSLRSLLVNPLQHSRAMLMMRFLYWVLSRTRSPSSTGLYISRARGPVRVDEQIGTGFFTHLRPEHLVPCNGAPVYQSCSLRYETTMSNSAQHLSWYIKEYTSLMIHGHLEVLFDAEPLTEPCHLSRKGDFDYFTIKLHSSRY